MSDETFKIPVAPKQRLYPLTRCNVGIVWGKGRKEYFQDK